MFNSKFAAPSNPVRAALTASLCAVVDDYGKPVFETMSMYGQTLNLCPFTCSRGFVFAQNFSL